MLSHKLAGCKSRNHGTAQITPKQQLELLTMEKNRKVANANASVNLLTWLAATHLLHIQQRSPVPFPQKNATTGRCQANLRADKRN